MDYNVRVDEIFTIFKDPIQKNKTNKVILVYLSAKLGLLWTQVLYQTLEFISNLEILEIAVELEVGLPEISRVCFFSLIMQSVKLGDLDLCRFASLAFFSLSTATSLLY